MAGHTHQLTALNELWPLLYKHDRYRADSGPVCARGCTRGSLGNNWCTASISSPDRIVTVCLLHPPGSGLLSYNLQSMQNITVPETSFINLILQWNLKPELWLLGETMQFFIYENTQKLIPLRFYLKLTQYLFTWMWYYSLKWLISRVAPMILKM